jgi:hypothetical protein
MRATIYQYTGFVTRSILRATEVAAVEIEEEPDNEDAFAEYHGGDFIEIDTSESDTSGDDINE